MSVLADKDFREGIINMIKELKQNSLDKLINRSEMAEERISEYKNRLIKNYPNQKTKRKKN